MSGRKEEETIIKECAERLKTGKLPPWKVEEEVETNYGIICPQNFRIAALCRQRFIEAETGERFVFISVAEKPYKVRYRCDKDELIWELDARDTNKMCSLCGNKLKSLDQHAPLVANYVGGCEEYYSYGGRIKVIGDLDTEFTNLLVYGTGLGPIGVTRGTYMINKFGGAEVKVSDFARAVRCLGLIFKTEELRRKAIKTIEVFLPEAKKEMNKEMSEFGGHISSVEFEQVESHLGFLLYVDFVADFPNARGHGDISHAVGHIKKEVEARLKRENIKYELSVIAQGYDGDLKPSVRNKRGRYASAKIRIPLKEFENSFGLSAKQFLSFVDVDCLGAQKLGCPFYSGMGGEIIPAIYRATKVNPRSPLVSSFQNISAGIEKNDVVYGVELPNVEVGIVSSREGLIPPPGREALRIMGIRTAKEFSASLAAQVLAGEFNLALEIARERLYN